MYSGVIQQATEFVHDRYESPCVLGIFRRRTSLYPVVSLNDYRNNGDGLIGRSHKRLLDDKAYSI